VDEGGGEEEAGGHDRRLRQLTESSPNRVALPGFNGSTTD